MIQHAQKTQQPVVGQAVDRVDGQLKVSGQARYPAEIPFERMAHAVLAQSTIACGSIKKIETGAAEAAPGVLTVLTHLNAPRLHASPPSFVVGSAPPPPLQDERIYYHGQHVAVVVAETLEQAVWAATLIALEYEEETPLLQFDDPRAQVLDNAFPDVVRGEPESALAEAAVRVEATYTTPTQHHNPLALAATIASWDGETLTLHDSTQGIYNTRAQLAMMLGLDVARVRVLAPFIGGRSAVVCAPGHMWFSQPSLPAMLAARSS